MLNVCSTIREHFPNEILCSIWFIDICSHSAEFAFYSNVMYIMYGLV